MEKKVTKRDNFNTLLKLAEVKSNKTLVDFINHEIELLDKKKSADRKPSAEQKANEELKNSIYAEMEVNRLYTITEMLKELPCCANLTNQKVSSMIRTMVDSPNYSIERIEEKRKAYFRRLAD